MNTESGEQERPTFEGDRMVRSSMTDTWYVVTRWQRTDSHMIEAIEKREATPEDADRINDRRSRPNAERDTDDGRVFTCRECAVEFADSGGIVKDPCPGCGEHVGFVRREWMRRGT